MNYSGSAHFGSPMRSIDDIKNGTEYKIPLYFNCNIHGPEISGTDGMLDFIEEILGTPLSSVLKDMVILINICSKSRRTLQGSRHPQRPRIRSE